MVTEDDARSSPIKFFFPLVSVQPTDQTGVIGGQAVFNVAFTSTNPALVTLQWQIQTDGATWGDLVETAGYYEGTATQTLTVKSIDNYLANRASLNFRCRALFAGAVPSFSNPAALSIPIHTAWTPLTGGTGTGATGAGVIIQANGIAPGTITGFAGPYTYTWSFVSGSAAIACFNTVVLAPQFRSNPAPAGIAVAFWKCTVTNGTQSVDTDPVPIISITPLTTSFQFENSQVVNYSLNGAAITVPGGFTFIPPWAPLLQQQLRRLTTPAIAILTPNNAATAFSFTGSAPPGSADIYNVYCTGTLIGTDLLVGGSSWQR